MPQSQQEAKKLERISNCLAYQEAVAWHVKSYIASHGQIHGYVKATIKIYLKPTSTGDLPEDRGDLDNIIKSVVDGLQYGGIFAPKPGNKKGNDKVVIRYGSGTGIYPDFNERVEILLETIDL